MIGYVPKTAFLPWLRNDMTSKAKMSDNDMKKEMDIRRSSMLYHFTRTGKYNKLRDDELDDDCVRVTRSSVAGDDEWMIDLGAANCNQCR